MRNTHAARGARRGKRAKPAAYVGYGGVGAARSIEHLRLICVELQMAPMRTGVHIQGGDFMAVLRQGKDIRELTYLQPIAKAMLDELQWWASALMVARNPVAASPENRSLAATA